MTSPNDPRPAESNCAGMWVRTKNDYDGCLYYLPKHLESDFPEGRRYVCLFNRDTPPFGELLCGYIVFKNGEWLGPDKPFEWLDESPEAIAEARQEDRFRQLEVMVFQDYPKKVQSLTTTNEKLKRERDELLKLLEISKCPQCDGGGSFYDGDGDPAQCQFCFERKESIASIKEKK